VELVAVRRTIAGDELESARRSLVDALHTGATASVVELNRVLRDHFDAFVLCADGSVVPIWKLVVPTTAAEQLLAQPESLLDDVLAPYRTAAEHALTLVSDTEHNAESSPRAVALEPAS